MWSGEAAVAEHSVGCEVNEATGGNVMTALAVAGSPAWEAGLPVS